MKIVNQVNDNILGNIFCVAQEDGRLKGWAKKYSIQENQEIWVYLNLYFVNLNFEYEDCYANALTQLKQGIKTNLDRIESSKKTLIGDIVDTFYDERDYHGYDEKIHDNQIKIEEIRVFKYNYSVIFSIDTIDEVFAFEVEENRKSINYEEQSEIVSMVY